MDRKYQDIPTQGRHRGVADAPPSNQNVRAPAPPDPDKAQGAPVGITYRYLFNEAEGTYRVHAAPADRVPEPMRGYAELGRYTSWEELKGTLAAHRDEPGRHVVFENTRTGEVYYDAESNVHDNWTGDGRFDVVTIFNDQNAAARYVDSRRSLRD